MMSMTTGLRNGPSSSEVYRQAHSVREVFFFLLDDLAQISRGLNSPGARLSLSTHANYGAERGEKIRATVIHLELLRDEIAGWRELSAVVYFGLGRKDHTAHGGHGRMWYVFSK